MAHCWVILDESDGKSILGRFASKTLAELAAKQRGYDDYSAIPCEKLEVARDN